VPGCCYSWRTCAWQRQSRAAETGRQPDASCPRESGVTAVMTRRDKHPSANQLASLAVGELRPRKAAKMEAHVAQCEQCTRICQQLGALRAILASTSYPPMPDNLTARIGSAISREAQQRLAAMPATETGRRGPPAHRLRAGAGGWHLLSLSVAATRLVAAAGVVVIAAAGSYLVAESVGTSVTRSSSSPLAGAAAPAQQMSLGPDVTYGQPGLLHTIRAVESRVNFVAAHLRAEAISAVHAAEDLDVFPALQSASTAASLTGGVADPSSNSPSPSRLAGCIGLLAPGQTVLVIDIARFQGKPASVIVTAATVVSEAEARVVGPSCSATTKDLLTQAALGYP
jgi:hypothetical protein